ncbi:hypothetical protein D9M68_995950 [compost metagenome]
MRRFHLNRKLSIHRLGQIGLKPGEIAARIGGLQRQLGPVRIGARVDRDARRIGAAVGHGDQHIGQKLAKLRLKLGIFEE